MKLLASFTWRSFLTHSWWLFLAARCRALCPDGFKKKRETKATRFKSLSYLCNEDNYEEMNCSPTKMELLFLRGRPQFLIFLKVSVTKVGGTQSILPTG